MEELSFQQLADKAEADLVDQFFNKEETGPVYESSRPPTPMSELSDNEKTKNDGLCHENNFSTELKSKIEKAAETTETSTASIEEIVTRTVSQLADTIQSLVVPERLEREIQIADDWRNLCRAICNNARLINSKLSFTKTVPKTRFFFAETRYQIIKNSILHKFLHSKLRLVRVLSVCPGFFA